MPFATATLPCTSVVKIIPAPPGPPELDATAVANSYYFINEVDCRDVDTYSLAFADHVEAAIAVPDVPAEEAVVKCIMMCHPMVMM